MNKKIIAVILLVLLIVSSVYMYKQNDIDNEGQEDELLPNTTIIISNMTEIIPKSTLKSPIENKSELLPETRVSGDFTVTKLTPEELQYLKDETWYSRNPDVEIPILSPTIFLSAFIMILMLIRKK